MPPLSVRNVSHRVFILTLSLLLFIDSIVVADLDLVILHNNDMHSRFEETNKLSGTCPKTKSGMCYGGFARVAHVVQAARTKAQTGRGPPVLYLNAGDTYTGTSWFSVHRWKIAAEFLNLLKPDAASLGNHEFDDGVQGLVPFLNAVQFPIVTANVDFSKEPDLQRTPLKPSVVLTVNNMKIGVIGYLTPETAIISQTENVKFRDEVPSIKEESEKLKSQGVKTIIALGHSGFEMDKIIAKQVPLVDIVIGGHTNTFLYNGPQPDTEVPEGLYPTVVTQASGKKVPVVQAYAYTKYLGVLKITLNDDGSVKHFEGQPMLLNSTVPQDQNVLKVLEKYRPAVDDLGKSIIGRTRVVLDSSECRKEECNFGNMIADAFVAYKSYFYGGSYWTDTPIAVQNGGGIRNSIDATSKSGNITRGDLIGVLPFDNRVVAISLNGSDILTMLETSVRSNGETSRGEYLQFSGLKVVYDTSKPTGSRVVAVSVRCSTCSVPTYEPLRPTKEYRLLVTQFLLNGGDGYNIIRDKAYKLEAQDMNDIDMVAWYLNKYSPVYPEINGRIINVADEKMSKTFYFANNSVMRQNANIFNYFIAFMTVLMLNRNFL